MIPIVALIAVAAIAIFRPLAVAEARKQASGLPTDMRTRLERIEQSVEAIAIEVERISEGQRFTTRLLSERSNLPTQIKAPADAERAGVPPGEQRS